MKRYLLAGAILLGLIAPASGADTYTPNLRIVQMPTGSNDTQWGTKANAAFAMLEQAISQGAAISVSAGGTITLTANDNATDQARSAVIAFTGSPSAGVTIDMPNVSKLTWVFNNSTQTLTFNAGSGVQASVTAGNVALIYSDGANNATSVVNISAAAANLLAATSNSAIQSALGLGTAATQSSSAFDAAGAATTAQTNAEAYADTNKLAKSSNLSDVASASSARTNLGLGTAATQASSAFDAAGAASAAQSAAQSFATSTVNALPNGSRTTITYSTSGPSGGSSGDLWVVY